jgi:hypothetical protein
MTSSDLIELISQRFGVTLTKQQAQDYADCLKECDDKYPDKADAIKLHACQLACVPDAVLQAAINARPQK